MSFRVKIVSPVELTTFSGMGGASEYDLRAIQINTVNPSTRTIMTDLLHQGESFPDLP
jgi:hypothetical protein